MSESHFLNALNSLKKPQEQTRLLKTLLYIKKEVDWRFKKENVVKLREQKCLKNLVGCLQNPYVPVVDLTLSVLGSCCMERSSAREVMKQHNILPELNRILKNHKEDSIYGRIFRIIGNTCEHWDRLSTTVLEREPSIISIIVEFMKEVVEYNEDEETETESIAKKATLPTVGLAVRALRELLSCYSMVQFVKNLGILSTIGLMLIKYVTMWEATKAKNCEDILKNIIRILFTYSKYKYIISITELQTTDKGNALTYLARILAFAPSKIVKTITNFMKVSTLRSDLPVVEICESLTAGIRTGGEVNRDYLKCLCYLASYPSNREKIHQVGVVSLFVNILNEYDSPDEVGIKNCILILWTLKNCVYDETAMNLLLKEDIIAVLRNKLEWIVNNSTLIDNDHAPKKRKVTFCEPPLKKFCCEHHNASFDVLANVECNFFGCRYGQCTQFPPCPQSLSDDDFTLSMELRSTSPSSSSEMSFSSPPSSPLAYMGEFSTNADESDSNDYSPVCSDAEETPAANDDLKLDTSNDNASELTDTSEKSVASLKVDLLLQIVALVKSFSTVRSELGCDRFLIALVMCTKITCIGNDVDEVRKLISTILDQPEHLLPLMETDFIPSVYDLTLNAHGDSCAICAQMNRTGRLVLDSFTKLAESGYGKGDIAHRLLRGTSIVKEKLVLVIPYVLRNKYILAKLMLNCGGLDTLMKLLRQNSDVRKKSVKVVCAMASKKLGIKNPRNAGQDRRKLKLFNMEYDLSLNCKNVVTFKLDDDSCVMADRTFLTEQSEYFNLLLSGRFKESHEEEVRLGNVASKSLKWLLMVLHGGITTSGLYDIDIDLHTILDCISLTDRFLMTDLCLCLSDSVGHFKLNPDSVAQIYQWSLESQTNILRIEAIAFALVDNVPDSVRSRMFQSLFDLGYIEALTEDIRSLLFRYLSMKYD